jgi:hypothetical protein
LNFVFYSVAIDESTDTTDAAQLAILIRGVDGNFKIMEELVALAPLKDTIKTTVLYTALQIMLKKCQLKINNVSALITDGAPAVRQQRRSYRDDKKNDAKESRNNDIMTFHCRMYQENTCAKSFPSF